MDALERFERLVAIGKRSAKVAELIAGWTGEREREVLRQDKIEGGREVGGIYLEIAMEWEATDNQLWQSLDRYA